MAKSKARPAKKKPKAPAKKKAKPAKKKPKAPAKKTAKPAVKKPKVEKVAATTETSGVLVLDDAARARVKAVLDGAGVATLVGPAELHYAANSWNWDDGVGQLRAIVERPDCALATAALVLWRGLPDEVIGFFPTRDDAEDEDGQGDVHDLQLAICARAAAGGYASHDIGFDPTDDDGTDWTEDWNAATAKHAIPDVLREPITGRRADRSQHAW